MAGSRPLAKQNTALPSTHQEMTQAPVPRSSDSSYFGQMPHSRISNYNVSSDNRPKFLTQQESNETGQPMGKSLDERR
jgi:hypothetical protein